MRRKATYTVFSVLLVVMLVANPFQCHCHCDDICPVEFLYDHRKRKHDDIIKLGPGLPPPAAWEARSRFCSPRNSDKLGVIESAENGLSDAFEAKAGVSDDEIKHENDCSLLRIEARVKKIDEVGHDEDVDEVGYDGDEDLSSAFSLLGLSEEDEEEVDERRIVRKLDKEKEEVPEGTPLFKEDSRHDRAGSRDTTVLHTAAMEPQRLYSISPNGSFKRNIKFWQKGERLGSGFFGTVYEAIADDGFFFAVKEVSLLDEGREGEKRIYQLEQEILLLSQSEHKNIVQYLGTDKDDSKLYIFLELATKGSLAKVYQKYHLRDPQVSAYTRQILNGLNYLHSRNVIHRDIKCANILVDAGGSVKLADFGLAKATRLNDINSCRGTPFWMAPEVVNQKNGYGLSADIWSLGCTVLEMLTCQIPYFPLEGVAAMFKIAMGELPPIPDSLSKHAQDFIFDCLKVDPDDRPTAAQLLDHPFVEGPACMSLI